MAGTKAGGDKAKAKLYERYGRSYYSRIGTIGGSIGRTGGFASELVGADGLTGKQRARIAGAIGGRKSRYPKKRI